MLKGLIEVISEHNSLAVAVKYILSKLLGDGANRVDEKEGRVNDGSSSLGHIA